MSTPIKPGDPIWVTTPGEDQAAAGYLVAVNSDSATVQLLSEPAGVHEVMEIRRVSYRSSTDNPPDSPPVSPQPTPPSAPEPSPAAPLSTAGAKPVPSAFDQLVALFPKVVERLEEDLVEAKNRRDAKREEFSSEALSYGQLRRIRGMQRRRLSAALKVLTRPITARGRGRANSNASWWTPERRAAQGERAKALNRRKKE